MFMLWHQHVASYINTADQTVHVYACWEFTTLHFQTLNKLKMGTSLCDVTVTLKRQRKIVNIFFLKQNTFFYKKIYVWHFYQKMHTELHSGLHYYPILYNFSSIYLLLNDVFTLINKCSICLVLKTRWVILL